MTGIEHANGHKPVSLWHVVDPNIGNAKRADPADYDFDLARTLGAVVQLRSRAPEDAFSSSYLGTEREGNAILLDDEGLCLTIGYLVTEAETILLGSEETTVTPAFFRAAILSAACPERPEMIAPAWPIRRPGGAVRPAINPAKGFLALAAL